MKRIYLVGANKDGTKLHLAQKQGAKFPSMELVLSPKVRTRLREIETERLARQGKKLPQEELEEARRAATAAETRAKRAGARAQKAWERQREAEDRLREQKRKAREAEERALQAERRAQLAERAGMADAARAGGQSAGVPPPPGFEPVGEETEGVRSLVRPTPEEAGETGPEEPAPAPEPRERRDLAPDSKLSPAEIQTLLRAGRGIRSVAKQAEVPVDWVRRLAAPIESERLGAVTQLLRSYVVRSRLGRSAMPIGPAIVENLREKGVRFPDRIVEEGWTAWRPDGRQWRVRFVYDSRGRSQRAEWRFDPQTREVTPQNQLAQELGFRSPEEGRVGRQAAEVNAAAIRPRRISGSRSSSGRAGGRKGSSKGGAKRASRSSGSSKRSSSSRGSSGRSRGSRR